MKNPFKKMMTNVQLSARYGSIGGRGQLLLNMSGDPEGVKERFSDSTFGGREVTIDEYYLKDLFYQQKARCYWLNTLMHLEHLFIPNHLLAPSVDRVDSSKGYIEGNVVICTRFCNRGRNNSTDEFFIRECVPSLKEGLESMDVECAGMLW